jgi:ketosteroid isomerase-like protein
MRRFVVAAVLLVICAIPLWCQDHAPTDQKAIEQALTVFAKAFDDLDWPAFRACFASDATVFYPVPQLAKRVDSATQFSQAWLAVFAEIKKNSGRTTPPYMDLQPRDVRIDVLSPDVAIATFHLVRDNAVSRRTLVWKKFPEGWKIVHLHASNLTVP